MTKGEKKIACRRKHSYPTEAFAMAARRVLTRKTNKSYSVYRCSVCHGYHLSSNHIGTVMRLFDVIEKERKAASG